jgi:hypothetical protein
MPGFVSIFFAVVVMVLRVDGGAGSESLTVPCFALVWAFTERAALVKDIQSN